MAVASQPDYIKATAEAKAPLKSSTVTADAARRHHARVVQGCERKVRRANAKDSCIKTEGKKIRNGLMVLSILLCSITSAAAQVSVSIGLPGLSIGINQPVYPELVAVPGVPRLLRSAGEFELFLL